MSVSFPFRFRFVSVLLMSPLQCRFVSISASVLFTFLSVSIAVSFPFAAVSYHSQCLPPATIPCWVALAGLILHTGLRCRWHWYVDLAGCENEFRTLYLSLAHFKGAASHFLLGDDQGGDATHGPSGTPEQEPTRNYLHH